MGALTGVRPGPAGPTVGRVRRRGPRSSRSGGPAGAAAAGRGAGSTGTGARAAAPASAVAAVTTRTTAATAAAAYRCRRRARPSGTSRRLRGQRAEPPLQRCGRPRWVPRAADSPARPRPGRAGRPRRRRTPSRSAWPSPAPAGRGRGSARSHHQKAISRGGRSGPCASSVSATDHPPARVARASCTVYRANRCNLRRTIAVAPRAPTRWHRRRDHVSIMLPARPPARGRRARHGRGTGRTRRRGRTRLVGSSTACGRLLMKFTPREGIACRTDPFC